MVQTRKRFLVYVSTRGLASTFKRAFMQLGSDITVASSPEEVQKALSESAFDFIIVDGTTNERLKPEKWSESDRLPPIICMPEHNAFINPDGTDSGVMHA